MSCVKIPYGSRKIAEKQLELIGNKLEKLETYKCKSCDSWHIGRAKKIFNPKFIQIDNHTIALGYKNGKKVVLDAPKQFKYIVGLTAEQVYSKLRFCYKVRLLK